jgi:hypothetical protein
MPSFAFAGCFPADWTLRDEIERYLVAHLHIAKETIMGSRQLRALVAEDNSIKELVRRILVEYKRARDR